MMTANSRQRHFNSRARPYENALSSSGPSGGRPPSHRIGPGGFQSHQGAPTTGTLRGLSEGTLRDNNDNTGTIVEGDEGSGVDTNGREATPTRSYRWQPLAVHEGSKDGAGSEEPLRPTPEQERGNATSASPFEPADPASVPSKEEDGRWLLPPVLRSRQWDTDRLISSSSGTPAPGSLADPDPDLDPVDPRDEALWDSAAAAPAWEQKPLQVRNG